MSAASSTAFSNEPGALPAPARVLWCIDAPDAARDPGRDWAEALHANGRVVHFCPLRSVRADSLIDDAEGAGHLPAGIAATQPVLLGGVGLAATLALSAGARPDSRVAAILAVRPFLGFDAPFYRKRGWKPFFDAAYWLGLARKPVLRSIAHWIACPQTMPELPGAARRPVSWAEMAELMPAGGFAGLLGGLERRSVIVMQAHEGKLDEGRVVHQIPAMNRHLSVLVTQTEGEHTAAALTEALRQLEAVDHGEAENE